MLARRLLPLVGAIFGASMQLNWLARWQKPVMPEMTEMIGRVAAATILMALILPGLHALTSRVATRLIQGTEIRSKFLRQHAMSYGVFLAPLLGAFGVSIRETAALVMLLSFTLWNGFAFYRAHPREERAILSSSIEWLACLFLVSGLAALVYQVTWQRTLFTFFGVNIESVTIVVTIFMFGLGVGSLLGGELSRRRPERLPEMFLVAEVMIGAFGLVSLPLIKGVGSAATNTETWVTAVLIFALLALPTLMMGATLPILVAYLHTRYKHIAKTVSRLYFLNTLGSALACFLTADLLFVVFGQQASVLIAALLNVTVGVLVYRYTRALKRTTA